MKIIQLAIIFLNITLLSCNGGDSKKEIETNNYKCEIMTQQSYIETIKVIEENVVDLTVPKDLLLETGFTTLFEDPKCNLDNAKHFLVETSVSSFGKQVIALSLIQLNKAEFIKMTEYIYEGIKNGKINETVFRVYLCVSLIDPPLKDLYKDDSQYISLKNRIKSEKVLSQDLLNSI